MVNYCVAYGCKNLQDPRKPVSFHCFPFKRPEILKLWIEALSRENDWYPSKSSRICGEHFLENDFQKRPGLVIKLLKPDAVPSIFVFPVNKNKVIPHNGINGSESMDGITVERPLELGDAANDNKPNLPSWTMHEIKVEPPELLDTAYDNEVNLPSSSQQSISHLVDCGTQTWERNPVENQLALLRRKVRTLNQKLRRKDQRILNLEEIIKTLKPISESKSKKGKSNENLDSVP